MEEKIKHIISNSLLSSEHITNSEIDNIGIELTRNSNNERGDFSSNIALKLSGKIKRSPIVVAEEIVSSIELCDGVDRVEVAKPGFINFYLSSENKNHLILDIIQQGKSYGSLCATNKKKILLEFVSANPTGPLHVGHGRHAAFGDSLARLLKKAGHDVFTEYYLNDAGRQIDILCISVLLQLLLLESNEIPKVEGIYEGSYIKDVALELSKQGVVVEKNFANKSNRGSPDEIVDKIILEAKDLLGPELFGKILEKTVSLMTKLLQNDLYGFRVRQDRFYSEKSLFFDGKIDEAINIIKNNGDAFRKDGALWLESSKYGDDKDRVVTRENGRSTYFASDIAYHHDKKQRGFDLLINVLGSDHHGYISRLEAGLASTGHKASDLEVILMQFVTLYRGKKKIQMSTRSGNFVPMKDLYKEVGVDAARFFYVSRSHDRHLDFDLSLATEQNNKNPVYYIQYANARIKSVMEELKKRGYTLDKEIGKLSLELLSLPIEEDIISILGKYPETILKSSEKRAVNMIPNYLKSLAQLFHSYYGSTKFMAKDVKVRNARLLLLLAVSIILEDGLEILGVSAPSKM